MELGVEMHNNAEQLSAEDLAQEAAERDAVRAAAAQDKKRKREEKRTVVVTSVLQYACTADGLGAASTRKATRTSEIRFFTTTDWRIFDGRSIGSCKKGKGEKEALTCQEVRQDICCAQ